MKCQRDQPLIIRWTLSLISEPLFIAKHLSHQSHTKTQSHNAVTDITNRKKIQHLMEHRATIQHLMEHRATAITQQHQLQLHSQLHLNTNQSQHIQMH